MYTHHASTSSKILLKSTISASYDSATNRFKLIFYGLAYFALYLVNYYTSISPSYSYAGMTTRDLPVWLWVFTAAMALLPLVWLPATCKAPSDYTIWILYISVIGPFPFIAALTSRADSFNAVLNMSVWLVASLAMLDFFRRIQILPNFTLPKTQSLYWLWLPIATLFLSLLVLVLNNFQINFSFDVYERRLAAREIVTTGSVNSYAIALLRGTCVPVMITIGLYHRKYLHLALSLIAVMIIFGFDGTKSSIFTPVLIGFVIWMTLNYKKNQGHILLVGLSALIALALTEKFIFSNSVISYLIIRRILSLPSLLTTYYWEFFSSNPYVLFSDNLLSGFITPRYDLAIPRVIGDVYFGRTETNANANIWASGYAQLGYTGVVLSSVIGGILLNIIDNASKNTQFVLGSVICAVIGLSWSQGALHTSLLSNGVAALVVILMVIPSLESQVKSQNTQSIKQKERFIFSKSI